MHQQGPSGDKPTGIQCFHCVCLAPTKLKRLLKKKKENRQFSMKQTNELRRQTKQEVNERRKDLKSVFSPRPKMVSICGKKKRK